MKNNFLQRLKSLIYFFLLQFSSCPARLAHSVEHETLNPRVVGSRKVIHIFDLQVWPLVCVSLVSLMLIWGSWPSTWSPSLVFISLFLDLLHWLPEEANNTGKYPSSIYSWFLKPLSVLHSRFPTKKSWVVAYFWQKKNSSQIFWKKKSLFLKATF